MWCYLLKLFARWLGNLLYDSLYSVWNVSQTLPSPQPQNMRLNAVLTSLQAGALSTHGDIDVLELRPEFVGHVTSCTAERRDEKSAPLREVSA